MMFQGFSLELKDALDAIDGSKKIVLLVYWSKVRRVDEKERTTIWNRIQRETALRGLQQQENTLIFY